MTTRTVDQLKTQYSSTEWRQKFTAYCNLIEILADCIIADDYSVSDALNSAIKLSPDGAAMRDKLTRKEGVKAKDANLMCALTVGHDVLYIDVDTVDLDALRDAIGAEFATGRITFPYLLGREFYDRFAELFEDERDSLTAVETQQLLADQPKGVFQYGHYTLGPFGLKESPVARSIKATRNVPAYHCAQAYCPVIHSAFLSTSHAATVNRDRQKLERLLQATTGDAAEWWPLADDLSGYTGGHYRDEKAGILLPLLGDCLTTDELRSLMRELLDHTRGRTRAALADVVTPGNSEEFVERLNRAQLLQLTLFADENDISTALDRLVHTGKIVIPRGDVRRPVTNMNITSGAFRLRGEISSHGVRFVSEDSGFALLRQRRLLDKLYLRDDKSDIHELEWQLRGVDVENLDERLEHFFRTTDPKTALQRLVLARRTNMLAACEYVGVEHGDDLSDEELISTILWKLGFSVDQNDDPHLDFWGRLEQLWALAQSSEIGASARFTEAAAPFFTRLEGILLDSLGFTAWALVNDHTTSANPYTYDNDSDRRDGLALLQSAFDDAISPDSRDSTDFVAERVTLGSLVQGFAAVAARLRKVEAEREHHLRPASELPSYHGKTELKSFLFESTVPYLDLSTPSRERIIEGLDIISKTLLDADVSNVRNDYSHYRRNGPDITKVSRALEAIRGAVTNIETLGFCRLLFTRSSVHVDEWGQSRHEYVGPRSYVHTLARPTKYDWMGLPRLDEPQYLLRAASFGDQREVLRFGRRFTSDFTDLWSGFPVRRRRGPGAGAAENGLQRTEKNPTVT